MSYVILRWYQLLFQSTLYVGYSPSHSLTHTNKPHTDFDVKVNSSPICFHQNCLTPFQFGENRTFQVLRTSESIVLPEIIATLVNHS